jgi:hypothetical protein
MIMLNEKIELYKKANTVRMIMKLPDLKDLVRYLQNEFKDITEHEDFFKLIQKIKAWIQENEK